MSPDSIMSWFVFLTLLFGAAIIGAAGAVCLISIPIMKAIKERQSR